MAPHVMNQRGNGASDLLGRVRESPDLLILDPAKTIVASSDMVCEFGVDVRGVVT
jgi:hypothetical protein